MVRGGTYMKYLKKLALLIVIPLLFTACGGQDNDENIVKAKPVVVKKLAVETYVDNLRYDGTIKPKLLIKKGFAKNGVIQKVYVKAGDRIKFGDLIASISYDDDIVELEDDNEKINELKEKYQEIESDLRMFSINYAKEKTSNNAKGGSKEKLAKLEKEIIDKEKEYKDKRDEYKKAVFYRLMRKRANMQDNIYSDVEGYVLKVLSNETEMTAAGYPVVLIRSNQLVVEAGISSEDAKKIKVGDVVDFEQKGETMLAIVTEIEGLPDENTGTYTLRAEIISKNDLQIGELVDLNVEIGEKKGIWVSINHIMNDGESYIYLVQDDRAVRRTVEILEIDDSKALINGVAEGDEMIIKGYNSVSDGYKVSVSNDEKADDENMTDEENSNEKSN